MALRRTCILRSNIQDLSSVRSSNFFLVPFQILTCTIWHLQALNGQPFLKSLKLPIFRFCNDRRMTVNRTSAAKGCLKESRPKSKIPAACLGGPFGRLQRVEHLSRTEGAKANRPNRESGLQMNGCNLRDVCGFMLWSLGSVASMAQGEMEEDFRGCTGCKGVRLNSVEAGLY